MRSNWKKNEPVQYEFNGDDYKSIVIYTAGVVSALMVVKLFVLLGWIGY